MFLNGFLNKFLVFCQLICLFLADFSIFGGYWAFLEARFLEEVGDEKPTPFLYKPGLLRPMGQSDLQSYAVGEPSQSHFVAG
jgi:hypothetical protein